MICILFLNTNTGDKNVNRLKEVKVIINVIFESLNKYKYYKQERRTR